MSVTDQANNERLLISGSRSFDVELSPLQTGAFARYLSLLSFWSTRLNLTAIREEESVVRLHFIDSLSVVRLLSPAGNLLDVGSGAGFPGIPIKLALPDKPVYLVEPRRKRANFLRHVTRELKLTGVHVIENRVESLADDELPAMAETITRGFSDLPGFLRVSGDLLASGGVAVLMQGPKGSTVLDEIRSHLPDCGLSAQRSIRFELPFGGERRTVLTFQRSCGSE